ncbi:hypothetical protein FS842_005227 [Serendipita sp. 407]|nr:hypothetical protein FRC18_005992 [Serendipita sp. 400]KAG9054404.1 hypothetical protein FS842_005227 [Serendipita sp. 407]
MEHRNDSGMEKGTSSHRRNTVVRLPNISYAEFRSNHLVLNQPVVIGPDLIQNWACLRYWRGTFSEEEQPNAARANTNKITLSTGYSSPNFDYMLEDYGEFVVPVDEDGCRSQKSLREVIDIWRSNDAKGRRLYVKDWHLALQLEKSDVRMEPFYTTPRIFADDWMNNYYLEKTDDDFRFVYMGPEGTFTRLHRDVYTSYSWSTNVVGRKRWWLFPPEVTQYITKPNGETIGDDNLLRDTGDAETVYATVEGWPNWPIAREKMIVVEQEEGESIFVPSGWYHQVLNLTFCISINHNWSNSHNFESMYHSMVEATRRVEDSIQDVKELLQKRSSQGGWEEEWHTIAQDLLKQDSGWDWSTLLAMVETNLKYPRELPPLIIRRDAQELEMTEQVSCVKRNDPKMIPDRKFMVDKIIPCITHFAQSEWGRSSRYGQLISRLESLLGNKDNRLT